MSVKDCNVILHSHGAVINDIRVELNELKEGSSYRVYYEVIIVVPQNIEYLLPKFLFWSYQNLWFQNIL